MRYSFELENLLHSLRYDLDLLNSQMLSDQQGEKALQESGQEYDREAAFILYDFQRRNAEHTREVALRVADLLDAAHKEAGVIYSTSPQPRRETVPEIAVRRDAQ